MDPRRHTIATIPLKTSLPAQFKVRVTWMSNSSPAPALPSSVGGGTEDGEAAPEAKRRQGGPTAGCFGDVALLPTGVELGRGRILGRWAGRPEVSLRIFASRRLPRRRAGQAQVLQDLPRDGAFPDGRDELAPSRKTSADGSLGSAPWTVSSGACISETFGSGPALSRNRRARRGDALCEHIQLLRPMDITPFLQLLRDWSWSRTILCQERHVERPRLSEMFPRG